MYKLNTKKERLEKRKAWINGKKTEVYKDLEILTEEKTNARGKLVFCLTVWKGTAGKPSVNFYYLNKEQRGKKIECLKKRADERAKPRERHVSTAALCAKEIRRELKLKYPCTKFSVRCENFSMGDAVNISWNFGPSGNTINEIVDKYRYGHFNSMEDIYEDSNRRDDIPQVKYVMTHHKVIL